MHGILQLPEEIQHIVLTGFMGSGKTTVGRVLARRLRWRFADLDVAVAKRAGRTVPEIFAKDGEAAFRAAEFAALRDLLGGGQSVIALGGGAPETAAVRDLLAVHPGIRVIHLHAPFETLYARCLYQAANPASTARPLLGDRADSAERYGRRLLLYTQVAHQVADAGARPGTVAAEILASLVSVPAPQLA